MSQDTVFELADAIDEMQVGSTIQIQDDYIYRRSEYSYILNSNKESYGFIDLIDKLTKEV